VSDRNPVRAVRDVPAALEPWSRSCAECAHTLDHGWTGVEGAAHCHECHHSWRSRRAAHCTRCCRTFTSYSAADEHDHELGCLHPAGVPTLTLAADRRSYRLAREPSISARRSGRSPGAQTATKNGESGEAA
jgi:hypothetical protein